MICSTRKALILLWLLWFPLLVVAGEEDYDKRPGKPRLCLALGAGGANGLAHIPMLEVLDDMEVKPYRISGSSIGAIFAAMYASGLSAREIRDFVVEFDLEENKPLEVVEKDLARWVDFIGLEFGRGGILDNKGFIQQLYNKIKSDDFSDLRVPLSVVAADLWNREQVVMDSGPLLPAIRASMALPGILKPVVLEGRVLVDGGTVNPVPYDVFGDDCDIVAGINVIGKRSKPEPPVPTFLDALFASVSVMHASIMDEKLKNHPPDIYISPDITDVRALEFYRSDEVFRQAKPFKQEFRRELKRAMKAAAREK